MKFDKTSSVVLIFLSLVITSQLDGEPNPKFKIGGRFDCLHDFNRSGGSTQDCIQASGLHFSATQNFSNDVTGYLRLDPFGAVSRSDEDSPILDRPAIRETPFNLIDDYSLVWQARPSLLFSIENYGGATLLPTVSGLSLGSRLDDAGWNQTAFSLTYLLGLGEGTEVKLVYGNGEGESGMNLDPQQYFGFHLKVEAIKGIEAHLGLSRDFNSQGSLRQSWLLQKYRQECEIDTTSLGAKQGYLTNRLSAALVADSIIDAAPGLKMALGWQRNVKSDLNKFTRSDLGAEELANCPRIDVNHFFIESPGDASANIVEANVFGFNAAYHFLSSYFIAFDYEQRTINSRDVKFFQPCERFVGTSCETGGKATQSEIKQTAYTYGGGVALSPSLILTLEYNTSSFDQMYNKVFYEEPGEAKQSQELFNARIAYQWDKER